MTNEEIIKDLLSKINLLQCTINEQNKFIMKMVTYGDKKELQNYRDRKDTFLQLFHMIQNNESLMDFLKRLFPDGKPNPAPDEDIH